MGATVTDDFTFNQSAPSPLESGARDERRVVSIRVDELEQALTNAVRRGINEAIRSATSDENVQLFWRRGFEEMSKHSSARLRDGIGGAVLRWGAGVLAAVGLALWVRFGPWK